MGYDWKAPATAQEIAHLSEHLSGFNLYKVTLSRPLYLIFQWLNTDRLTIGIITRTAPPIHTCPFTLGSAALNDIGIRKIA